MGMIMVGIMASGILGWTIGFGDLAERSWKSVY